MASVQALAAKRAKRQLEVHIGLTLRCFATRLTARFLPAMSLRVDVTLLPPVPSAIDFFTTGVATGRSDLHARIVRDGNSAFTALSGDHT